MTGLQKSQSRLSIRDLELIHLSHGSHITRENGVCAMEAAAWLAGREHNDHPICVSPTIGAFMRSWNDSLPSDTERDRLLKPLLPQILQTVSTKEIEKERGWMAVDWLARTFTPSFLVHVPKLRVHAEALRNLDQFMADTWNRNGPVLNAARAAARAAAGRSLAPIVA